MNVFEQTNSDKRQVKFFKEHIPEMLTIPNVEKLWHKYKTKASIADMKDVYNSYEEMKKIVNIFVEFLNKEFADFEFKDAPIRQNIDADIIMYWHQGKENMPKCSKLCYNSFVVNQKRRISLLDYEEVKKLVDINPNVTKSYNAGNITCAEYSDYLRMLLLEKYNVMWVDSTIFCIGDIPDEYFTQSFWSIKGNYMQNYAEKVKALTYDCHFGQIYLLGGKDNYIFSRVRQMIEHFYEKYDSSYCYFMVYTFFEWLYRYDLKAKQQIDELKENNTNVEYLTCMRDAEINDSTLNAMLNNDTVFYKLSNRIEYDYSEKTFIGAFIKAHMKGDI